MKIGDRVVMIRDCLYAKKGMTGKVIQPQYRGQTDTLWTVEFDPPFTGGHTCGGYVPSGRGYCVPESALKALYDDKNWKIIITANGDATTAKLIQEGKCIKEVSVNRYFKDEYNAEVGAKEAISKLFKPAGYTGKAMFVGEDTNDCGFTRGKIYQFTDGQCIDDDNDVRPYDDATTLNGNDWFSKVFIKVVE